MLIVDFVHPGLADDPAFLAHPSAVTPPPPPPPPPQTQGPPPPPPKSPAAAAAKPRGKRGRKKAAATQRDGGAGGAGGEMGVIGRRAAGAARHFEQLVSPMLPAEFLAERWQRRPAVLRSPGRFPGLPGLGEVRYAEPKRWRAGLIRPCWSSLWCDTAFPSPSIVNAFPSPPTAFPLSFLDLPLSTAFP